MASRCEKNHKTTGHAAAIAKEAATARAVRRNESSRGDETLSAVASSHRRIRGRQ